MRKRNADKQLNRSELSNRAARLTTALLFAFATSSAVADSPAAPAKASLEDIAFMAGCWEGDLKDGTKIRETYTAPRGGFMLGNSQVVAGSETKFFEFIQVLSADGGVVYRPSPNAKDTVGFALVKFSSTLAVFENPAHDFPQRIVYQSDGNSRLTARIEKLDGSKAQSFEMKAVACGGESYRKALR